MARFKDPKMQRMYEFCRAGGADRTSEFYDGIRPHRGTGYRNAYWLGRFGHPTRYLRTSLTYAAWAAGRDDERAGR